MIKVSRFGKAIPHLEFDRIRNMYAISFQIKYRTEKIVIFF